jgi:tetratricopeptide (TPR) repeat protein
MVLGSDSAPYGFPGVSAHQELQELVDAGLSPYQALLTATRNAGTFISKYIPSAPHFGTVAEGAQADLLLLSDNPLIDIKNIGHIAGVMLRGKWLPAEEITSLRTETSKRFANVKEQLLKIDSDLETGDVSSARKYMQQYPPDYSPWYSEWVLMTKARKLQNKNLRVAIELARLDTALYPQSFSSWNLLGDLLFQDGQFDAALSNVRKSLAIEPYNSASQNLLQKIQALQHGPQFSPTGRYDIEYTDDQNHSAQSTHLQIERSAEGQLRGTKADGTESSSLRSVFAGNDRLWAVADTQFGQIEFRIIVHGNTLTGYWAGPFGHNGNLRGTKSESPTIAH